MIQMPTDEAKKQTHLKNLKILENLTSTDFRDALNKIKKKSTTENKDFLLALSEYLEHIQSANIETDSTTGSTSTDSAKKYPDTSKIALFSIICKYTTKDKTQRENARKWYLTKLVDGTATDNKEILKDHISKKSANKQDQKQLDADLSALVKNFQENKTPIDQVITKYLSNPNFSHRAIKNAIGLYIKDGNPDIDILKEIYKMDNKAFTLTSKLAISKANPLSTLTPQAIRYNLAHKNIKKAITGISAILATAGAVAGGGAGIAIQQNRAVPLEGKVASEFSSYVEDTEKSLVGILQKHGATLEGATILDVQPTDSETKISGDTFKNAEKTEYDSSFDIIVPISDKDFVTSYTTLNDYIQKNEIPAKPDRPSKKASNADIEAYNTSLSNYDKYMEHISSFGSKLKSFVEGNLNENSLKGNVKYSSKYVPEESLTKALQAKLGSALKESSTTSTTPISSEFKSDNYVLDSFNTGDQVGPDLKFNVNILIEDKGVSKAITELKLVLVGSTLSNAVHNFVASTSSVDPVLQTIEINNVVRLAKQTAENPTGAPTTAYKTINAPSVTPPILPPTPGDPTKPTDGPINPSSPVIPSNPTGGGGGGGIQKPKSHSLNF